MPRTARHVLIIDDHAEVRRMLRAGIETLGSEVKVTDVPSAEEGILVLTRQKIDLLVTDVHLPGISGLELKQKAMRRSPGMKLILITGVTDPQVRQQVAEAGADAFFFKPLQLSEFLKQVEDCLKLHPGIIHDSPARSPQPAKTTRVAPLEQALEELGAAWVVWFDLKGRVLAQAGRFSGSALDANLAPLILKNLSALTDLSRFFDSPSPQDFLVMQAPGIRLLLSHVGSSTALIAAIAGDPGKQNPEKGFSSFRKAVQALEAARPPVKSREKKPTSPPQNPQPKQAPSPQPLQPVPKKSRQDRDLAGLFQQESRKQAIPQDVDAFWESVADQADSSQPPNQDTLSFEEAQERGIAPEE